MSDEISPAVSRATAFVDAKTIRLRRNMSQSQFCKTYGLRVDRLRNWEQRLSRPKAFERLMLLMIDKAPEVVAGVIDGTFRAETGHPSIWIDIGYGTTQKRVELGSAGWNIGATGPAEPEATSSSIATDARGDEFPND